MSELFREVDEALQQDRARQLWQKYGTWIIAAVLAIILLTGGYVFWQNYQQSQREAASGALIGAMTLAESDEAMGLDALASTASGGGDLGALARLNQAALLADTGDLEGAVAGFRAVAEDSAVDPLFRSLGRLMVVLHQIDSGDPAILADELASLEGGPWDFTARELTAMLAMRQGDVIRARDIYQALAADEAAPAGLRARAEEMVSVIGS